MNEPLYGSSISRLRLVAREAMEMASDLAGYTNLSPAQDLARQAVTLAAVNLKGALKIIEESQ